MISGRLTKVAAKGFKTAYVLTLSDGRMIIMDKHDLDTFEIVLKREFKGGTERYQYGNLRCFSCENEFVSFHAIGQKHVACECGVPVSTSQAKMP